MAMTFNGSDPEYINFGQPSQLNLLPSSPYSFSCWIKTASGNQGALISRGNATSKQYQLNVGNPVGANCYIQGSVGNTFTNGSTVANDNQWHFFVLVTNGTTFYLYMDAVLESSAAVGSDTEACDTLMGCRRNSGNTGTGYPYTGTIDDFRIYNRALSLAEIQTMFHCRRKDNIIDGLIFRTELTENYPGQTASGSGVIKESSNYKQDGTPTNEPIWAESVF